MHVVSSKILSMTAESSETTANSSLGRRISNRHSSIVSFNALSVSSIPFSNRPVWKAASKTFERALPAMALNLLILVRVSASNARWLPLNTRQHCSSMPNFSSFSAILSLSISVAVAVGAALASAAARTFPLVARKPPLRCIAFPNCVLMSETSPGECASVLSKSLVADSVGVRDITSCFDMRRMTKAEMEAKGRPWWVGQLSS